MAMETADDETEPRRGRGPMQFWREVQAEARKVTWATRNEVVISTIMVMMMTTAAALFFFAVDTLVSFLISLVLSLHF